MSYTYLIGWSEYDRWYYGKRTANKLSPDHDLWKVYFTSSKYVNHVRNILGEPDVIRVHKTFENNEDANEFEERFLSRVNAVSSPRWINRGNGGRKFFHNTSLSDENKKKLSESKKGRPRSLQCRQRISKTRLDRKIPSPRKGANHTQEAKDKLSKAMKGRTPHNKGKPASEEQKRKQSESMKGRTPWNKGVCRL